MLRYSDENLRRYANILQNEVGTDIDAAANHLSRIEWRTPGEHPNVDGNIIRIRRLRSSVMSISSALSRTSNSLQMTMRAQRAEFNRFPNIAANANRSRLIRNVVLTIRFPRNSPFISDVINVLSNRFGRI